MLAVIESAQDLSSRLNLTNLLRAIVSKARNLLRLGPGLGCRPTTPNAVSSTSWSPKVRCRAA